MSIVYLCRCSQRAAVYHYCCVDALSVQQFTIIVVSMLSARSSLPLLLCRCSQCAAVYHYCCVDALSVQQFTIVVVSMLSVLQFTIIVIKTSSTGSSGKKIVYILLSQPHKHLYHGKLKNKLREATSD